MTREELLELAEVLTEKTKYLTKETLTMKEVAEYMGCSTNWLYKLTSEGKIPFYKPFGKMIFFKKSEVDAFLQTNRQSTFAEIHAKAAAYCQSNNIL